MTKGIKTLCMLEVINEFAESIGGKVRNEFRFEDKSAILNVNDYRAYCVKLLSNNGLNPERDMEEMEKFMQDVLFAICDLTGTGVSAMRWLNDDMVQLVR